MPRRNRKERIDPATRTFQALRIAVNQELRELETALQCLPGCLAEGGRLAVISFHSLEDRLVKQAFRGDPRWKALTKKPIRPSEEEMQRNPPAAQREAASSVAHGDGRRRTEGVEVDGSPIGHITVHADGNGAAAYTHCSCSDPGTRPAAPLPMRSCPRFPPSA